MSAESHPLIRLASIHPRPLAAFDTQDNNGQPHPAADPLSAACAHHNKNGAESLPSRAGDKARAAAADRLADALLVRPLRRALAWAGALIAVPASFAGPKNALPSHERVEEALGADNFLEWSNKRSRIGSTCGDVSCDGFEPQSLALPLPRGLPSLGLETGRFKRSFAGWLPLGDGWFKSLQRFEDKWYKLCLIPVARESLAQFQEDPLCVRLSLLTSAAHRNLAGYVTFWGEEQVAAPGAALHIYLQAALGPACTLADYLRHAPLGPADAFFLFSQILSGLGYLHDRGIVHGALSAATVLVGEGEVQLTSFGLSSLRGCPASLADDVAALARLLEELIAHSEAHPGAEAVLRQLESAIASGEERGASWLLRAEAYDVWLRGVFASFDCGLKPPL